MQQMAGSSKIAENPLFFLGLGIAAGLAMCFSAIAQGKAGAAGSDALGETGKGFSNYIMVVGRERNCCAFRDGIRNDPVLKKLHPVIFLTDENFLFT